MGDKLDRIFELQARFQKDLAARRGLHGIPMEDWLQRMTLAMVSELAELIGEVNFKWWKDPKPVDPDRVRDELADILHFFVGMCLSAGLTAEELFARYAAKNRVNFQRQDGEAGGEGYASPPSGGE